MLTVVDGAMDALDRVASAVVRLGDRVLVENPCFPPLLDLLETLGTEPIGLELDDEGLRPEALAAGLTHSPTALFLQPRAHNPAGVGLSAGRARKLASLLRGTDVVVIEDDHAGDIADGPLVSLGSHLPAHTVHVRSFSKSHGPDLRLAAVGGAGDIVHAVVNRRLLGPGWSSRLLQALLVELLHDERTIDSVARARRAYAARRATFSAALAERTVTTSGRDGINLWIKVADERSALVTLAARGVGVAPGTPFVVHPLPTDHVRLTVGQVHGGGVDALAGQVMLAAASGRCSGRAPRWRGAFSGRALRLVERNRTRAVVEPAAELDSAGRGALASTRRCDGERRDRCASRRPRAGSRRPSALRG
jgi:DNA-binding transcriptional MocR family regulator